MTRLYRRLYGHRRVLAYVLYGVLAGLAYGAAFLLRFEFSLDPEQFRALQVTVPAVVLVRLALARVFKLSTGRWRFVGTGEVLRLFAAMSLGSVLLLLFRDLVSPVVVIPRSVLLMEWVFSVYITAGIWISYRVGYERLRRAREADNGDTPRRALIVGAGEAGNMLAREIQRFPTGYQLVGFVDDDPMKWGSRIQGVEVIGGSQDLDVIAESEGIEEIILAVPSADPEELRRLVEQCESTQVPFKVLPGIKEVLHGQVGMSQLRELRIEDLLGRDPIELELPELAEDLDGLSVLITGAAGSIGSELARQVALHHPARLILLDQAETPLFYVDLELREAHPDLELIPIIADVADEPSIDRVFKHHSPDRVFHAAAYKHVPLMEHNIEQAVKNNVVGTSIVAHAAGKHRSGKFVLVSTDKAVRPANIMGSTKRLAELVVLDMQDRYPETTYGAVRFGNVLGSNGSVIPIFERQAAAGKPLTVTHPDVTRYFMTIPEAVQLILQASLLPGFRGHIAMLDMGEPVKILELALNFLRLSGIPPWEDKTYRFTGLRQGEKMHEELSAPHEEPVETSIPKVRLLSTHGDGLLDVAGLVGRWEMALSNGHSSDVELDLRTLFVGLQNGKENGAPAERSKPQLVGRDTKASA